MRPLEREEEEGIRDDRQSLAQRVAGQEAVALERVRGKRTI